MELEVSNDFCMQSWDNARWKKDCGEESLNQGSSVALGDFVHDEMWLRMEERDWTWEDWQVRREWDVVGRVDGEDLYEEEEHRDLVDEPGDDDWEQL